MAGNARIDRGHGAAPLIAHLVQIGVADAAEQNLNLYVGFGGIAPRDRGGGERRCSAGSGVCFRVVHKPTLLRARAVEEGWTGRNRKAPILLEKDGLSCSS